MAAPIEIKWHLPNLWYALGIGLLVLIAILSLMPVADAPETNDKLVHVIMYAVPSAWFSLIVSKRSSLAWVFVSLVGYGFLMEFFQGLTDYRSQDMLDAVANGFGVLIGLSFHFSAFRRWLVKIDNYLSVLRHRRFN